MTAAFSWSSLPFTSICPSDLTLKRDSLRISTAQGVGRHVTISVRGLDRTAYVRPLQRFHRHWPRCRWPGDRRDTLRNHLGSISLSLASLNFGAWFAWLTKTSVPVRRSSRRAIACQHRQWRPSRTGSRRSPLHAGRLPSASRSSDTGV